MKTSPSQMPSARDPSNFADATSPSQLERMKAQVDLVLMALESLTGVDVAALIAAGEGLDLGRRQRNTAALWDWFEDRFLTEATENPDPEAMVELQCLILLGCHLARLHQTQIRQAVARLEQVVAEKSQRHQDSLLANYLDTFSHYHRERLGDAVGTNRDQLACSLLVRLLFYSGPKGDEYFASSLLYSIRGKAGGR